MLVRKTESRSISELYDKCSYDDWLKVCEYQNYHELIKTALELYIKHNLDIQRENLGKYALKKYSSMTIDPIQQKELRYIFLMQKVDPKIFCRNLIELLKKQHFKKNCLRIWGCINSCKTLIANCITEPFIKCYMNNHGSENEFFMSNMLNKAIIHCEEIYITIATAEDFKSVLGGQPIDIAKKFNEKQTLSKTPVIITSNYYKFGRGHLSVLDECALRERCYDYNFDTEYKPKCKITTEQFYIFVANNLY